MVSARSKKGTRLESLGKTLQQAREEKKVSIKTVSEVLTVPEHYIQALEDGDMTVFPAEVYAWGSYQKYASYVGLGEQKNKQAFLRALSKSRELVPLKVHQPRSWLTRVVTGHILIMVAASVVALGVGSYVAWQVQSFLQVPSITILEPKIDTVESDKVILHGIGENGADITINGEKILMDENETFTTTLYLHPGINHLRLEATNAAGRVRLIERDLLYPRV